jgi:hypothetical protein
MAKSSGSLLKLILVVLVAGIAISLNFLVLWQAIPETQKIDSGCCAPSNALLAKDFSAYYFAAWNLFHNPAAIYSTGSSANATFLGITPHPETFKYLPMFLLLASPLLLLGYQQALYTFDAIQFALLLLIAFLIYRLLAEKSIAIIAPVLVIGLLLPFSTALNWSISEAYFWQWAEGQSKVLELALILIGLYFGKKDKPIVSGIFFGLSFFDPQVTIFAVPLFIALNGSRIIRAAASLVLTLLVTNFPLIVFAGVASGFIGMLLSGGAATPLHYYTYIPLLTIIVLSFAMWKEIGSAFKGLLAIEKSPAKSHLPKVDTPSRLKSK